MNPSSPMLKESINHKGWMPRDEKWGETKPGYLDFLALEGSLYSFPGLALLQPLLVPFAHQGSLLQILVCNHRGIAFPGCYFTAELYGVNWILIPFLGQLERKGQPLISPSPEGVAPWQGWRVELWSPQATLPTLWAFSQIPYTLLESHWEGWHFHFNSREAGRTCIWEGRIALQASLQWLWNWEQKAHTRTHPKKVWIEHILCILK